MPEPSEVEFVVDADREDGSVDRSVNGSFEPDGPSLSSTDRRRSGVLALMVVAAIGVALIARSATANHPTAAPKSAPTPSVTQSSRPPESRPPGCPIGADCDVVRTIPDTTVAAVRAAFPAAHLQYARSVVVRDGSGFGSPLVHRHVAFRTSDTRVSIDMTQRRCAETEPGDRVTRQYLKRMTSTLLVKAVPGDVEGDVRVNDAGNGADDAYCFLAAFSVDQPHGSTPVPIVDLDRLSVDAALQSTG